MDYKDYNGIAQELVALLGGKENISNLTHCITRLRFVLKDRNKVSKEEVEKLPLVMSVIEQGGQFQVVIGDKVDKVFNALQPLLDLEKESGTSGNSGKPLDRMIAFLSGVFTPILGILSAEGVIKGLLVVLPLIGVLDQSSSTYLFLNAVSDIIYYFFPVFMGVSAARYLKMNEFIGLAIGAGMIAPQFVAAAADGSISSLFGIPMKISSYTSTVFPAIFAVLLGYYVKKGFEKICPSLFRFFLVPLVTILVVLPLTFWVIGPVITFLGNIIASVLTAIYNFSPIIAGLLIGGPWMLLVMLGLHNAFIPIFVMDIVEKGSEPICGLFAANQMAVAGAAVGLGLALKDKEKKAAALTNGITCLLGTSEPAIYGQLVPYKTPFTVAIIIGSIGGAIGGAVGLAAYAFGLAGILGFSCYINPAKGIDASFIIGFGAAVLSFFAAAAVTYIVMKKDPRVVEENSLA